MHPFRINLERARREAKALLADARAGNPAALARLPSGRLSQLADAQLVIARGYGFRSWAELVRGTEDPGGALRRAARLGDDELLYALLEAGAPANSRDPRTGRTALLEAAAADQLDTLAALVGWVPTDKFAVDRRGHNALDLARADSPVAEVLSSCGLGPAQPTIGDTFAVTAHAVEVAFVDHVSRAPGMMRASVGDGFVFRTGMGDNTRNAVVCSQLPSDRSVASVIALLEGVPAIWYTGPSAATSLRQELEQAGARPERNAVHMAARLDDLDGQRSSDVTEVHADGDLVHLDADEAALLAAAGLPMRHFTIDGVAGITVFTSGSTMLITHLGVTKPRRRRGLARCLVRHAVAIAQHDGLEVAVVEPTPATVPLYQKFGFVLERALADALYYLPD